MTDTATILQQNLREFGIEVELNQVAPGSFYGVIAEQDYVAGLEYWNSVLYPGYYMFQLFAEFGGYWGWSRWGKYGDTQEPAQQLTEVMREARESPARDHRAPLLKEAQQIFSDWAIFGLVGGVNTDQLWRERVQNYHVMPSTWNNLRRVGTE
jgi:ABC-type transport system substrate-binding protein